MQAHPLSSPAARIPSTSPPASSPTSSPTSSQASSSTPHPPSPRAQSRARVLLSGKASSNLPGNLPGKPAPSSKSPAPPPTPISASVGLAHDARNLLGALGLYCDLLSAPGVLRPEHRHYATELSLISNRSSELIRRLLAAPSPTTPVRAHASTSAAALTHVPAPTQDHASMLHSLAPVLERIAAGSATVSVTCPKSLPPLSFPSEVIERITVNLVRNAAEALRSQRSSRNPRGNTHAHSNTNGRGEIRIILAILHNRLQLTVEDNGPGMPPAIAAAFLQPSPLPRGATRGLGHRIIHELAAASAGQLSVRVRPGKGTVFCIKWPIPAPVTPSAPQPHL